MNDLVITIVVVIASFSLLWVSIGWVRMANEESYGWALVVYIVSSAVCVFTTAVILVTQHAGVVLG